MPLPDLEAKYLHPGAATYRADTEAVPLIDGVVYFKAVYDAIKLTSGPGDVIYILNWRFDPAFDLLGAQSGTASYQPLGQLLADKAAAGVDVRLVLDGALFSSKFPPPGLGFLPRIAGFRDNALAAYSLRRQMAAGASSPPLAGRVLLDWSGSLLGSHHQKATLVQTGNDAIAFVGGLDFWPNRLDISPHNLQTYKDGSRWGWHDAGVRLRGRAVAEVWENFRTRWMEARSLWLSNLLGYWVRPAGSVFPNWERFIPPNLPPDPPAAPAMTVVPAQQSLQVLRSRFRYKYRFPLPGTPWTFAPTGGLYETFNTLVRAIGAAQKYIYIEDQFLADNTYRDIKYSLFPRLRDAAARDVKVILVSSGKSDPDDMPSGEKNLTLTGDVRTILDTLPEAQQRNVVVYRVKNLTIHSKLILIDDCFAAIGTANLQNRSMDGQDYELHVALVDDSTPVRALRVDLWAEHLRVQLGDPHLQAALEDIDTALGIWRPDWLPTGASPDTWRTPNVPVGFLPAETVLALVGPL